MDDRPGLDSLSIISIDKILFKTAAQASPTGRPAAGSRKAVEQVAATTA
jgi:hypothetical protein